MNLMDLPFLSRFLMENDGTGVKDIRRGGREPRQPKPKPKPTKPTKIPTSKPDWTLSLSFLI